MIQLDPNRTFEEPFFHALLWEILDRDILNRAIKSANKYPFFKIEKSRISSPNRIWLNQIPGMCSAIAEEFDQPDIKRLLGSLLETNFFGLRTRAELCMDSVGSWLEPHGDDPAKKMSLQLYLSDYGSGTLLGTEVTNVKAGTGWAFANTGKEIHSLPALRYNRISIIINYVNDEWRDESVLL